VRGDKVIALARRLEKLEVLAAQNQNITPFQYDLSDLENIETLVLKLSGQFPDLNIIINNAGIQDNVRIDADGYGLEDIEREIKLNLTAPIALCQAFLPVLKSRKFLQGDKAVIVNITSGLAYVPKLTSAVYSATKSGLHLFTDALRVQEPDLQISEVILPLVKTEMTAGRNEGGIEASLAASQIVAGIVAKRDRIYVGKTKALMPILRVSPKLAANIIQKGN